MIKNIEQIDEHVDGNELIDTSNYLNELLSEQLTKEQYNQMRLLIEIERELTIREGC